jgi:transposase
MRRSRSREELIHEAVLLHKQGTSGRAIARALGVARKTVTKLLEQHATEREAPSLALGEAPARAPRPSKLDGHRVAITGLLQRFPEITAQRVFEEIRLLGFAGGYTAVKELLRKVRPKPKPEPSRPTPVYGPAEMSECDWSPYTVPFTHAPACTVQAFGYALNHSHRKFFGFYATNDLHALMDGHVEAFARFKGVAKATKYDSQKPVVLRWEGNQPIYNLRFVDFATYYEFQLVACRRGHPNDKPKVERSFWELERSFFNGREFRDQADLVAQLRWWMANVSDQRPHKKAKLTPLELFVTEQFALRPLPAHPYDTARVVYRLCDIEGFLAWDGNRYSLPYEHVTDILPVRITQRELYVYAADLRLIARHELCRKGLGKDVELPGHHPRSSVRGADLDQLRRAFEEMGLGAPAFLSALESARPRSAAYHARHILVLRQRYDTLDVVKALDHAQRFGAFDHTAIERILFARATPRRLDEYVANKRIEALMGEPHTQARDLAEYDALPCWGSLTQGGVTCTEQATAPAANPQSPLPPQPPALDPDPAAR